MTINPAVSKSTLVVAIIAPIPIKIGFIFTSYYNPTKTKKKYLLITVIISKKQKNGAGAVNYLITQLPNYFTAHRFPEIIWSTIPYSFASSAVR